MSTGTLTPESRGSSVVLHGISWQAYVDLRDSPENEHVRMTYDQGSLEFMSPSKLHERLGYLIGRCIDVWTEEKRIPIQGCRTTTFRREDLLRGLEPDNCYYIQHEAVVREREEIDLAIDPPPDLTIEVDVSSRSLKRLPVYAALGVPEIWRWQRNSLHVLLLSPGGEYVESSTSRALPEFPFEELAGVLERRTTSDETTLIREFRRACRSKDP